jgi:hypothetical protein
MGDNSKTTAVRSGDPLKIGRETVKYGRNILGSETPYGLQHRLFVNDPWELIAEAIHRSLPNNRVRDTAHSFRRQAQDYFRAATVADDLAVRPVLLYYAFLNLSKAFAMGKGTVQLAKRAYHGVASDPKPRSIPNSVIKFDVRKKPAVFQELLQKLDATSTANKSDIALGHLLPQILPGHRLWCYATKKTERFISVDNFEIIHQPLSRMVWLNICINRSDLDRLNLSERTALTHANLLKEFEAVGNHAEEVVRFQQRNPTHYTTDPAEALGIIINNTKNNIWETAKLVSPYRKSYIYCSPKNEHSSRMPQILSIYLLMFFLSSVTRYSPEYFENLFESKYGPFFETFISESPMQFLYLLASEILGREVSRPAII